MASGIKSSLACIASRTPSCLHRFEKCGQMLIMVDVEPAIQSDAPSRQVLTGRVGVVILFGVADEVLRKHRLRPLSFLAAGGCPRGLPPTFVSAPTFLKDPLCIANVRSRSW